MPPQQSPFSPTACPSLRFANLAFAPTLMRKVLLIFSINLLAGALVSTLPLITGAFFKPLARRPNATLSLTHSAPHIPHVHSVTDGRTDTEVYIPVQKRGRCLWGW